MQKRSIFSQYTIRVLFVIILCLPLVDLLHSGLPITHDGQDHVARIANFYQSLSEGILVPRWAENLNWGYGHPILMFLYPLPSYIASFFHMFTLSFVDSVKAVFGVSFVLSGLSMYIWMKEEAGEEAGVLAGLLYTFAPYRFVDLYVRGAIGEHVAFIFPPLILYFLLKLSKKDSSLFLSGAVLSLAGLILSHNAISLMFLPIILLYMTYRTYMTHGINRVHLAFQYGGVFLLAFGVSAFFWLPALVEGKYTLRDIVTATDFATRFVAWRDFFYRPWSYGGTDTLSKQIGIVQWIFILDAIAGLFVFKKARQKKVFLGVLLCMFIGSLFIMTQTAFFIWQHVSLLAKFQFPWRFLSVSVFVAAAIGGYSMQFISRKYQSTILVVAALALLVSTFSYWHARAFLQKPESFYTNTYNSTTDTGESSPIWSVRFMERRPKAHMEIIDGEVEISEQRRTSTLHIYEVKAEKKSRLIENTLYFPGWKIFVDGREVLPEYQDPNYRGIMTFWLEPGKHLVEAKFSETKLRILADYISLASILLLISYVIVVRMKDKHLIS